MISVIVPAYNTGEIIKRTLDSILEQTYPNIEVIVVDDGSTDNTRMYIEQYAKKYPEIIRPLYTVNQGVSCARLKGVKFAKGEWIGFVDSDDVVENDMYEILIRNAEISQAEISHCGFKMIFEDGRVNYFHNTGCCIEHNKIDGIKELLEGKIIEPSLCNKIFRKSLFKKILDADLMNTEIRINEDLLLNYYLFEEADKSVFEDVCKYCYLVRNTSVSRQTLNEYKIFDPIRVKMIIYDSCTESLKSDAEKALVTTCVYTYCALVLDKRKFRSEKEKVRNTISKHDSCIQFLTKRTKILAILICKLPFVFEFIYLIYAKFFQKSVYR